MLVVEQFLFNDYFFRDSIYYFRYFYSRRVWCRLSVSNRLIRFAGTETQQNKAKYRKYSSFLHPNYLFCEYTVFYWNTDKS